MRDFVEKDLLDAINALPLKNAAPASYLGRATKGSAMGLLSKVYLYQKKFGDAPAVNAGFMYAYSAKADYKNAITYAQKAQAQAPNDAAKQALQGQIDKLKDGKDIN